MANKYTIDEVIEILEEVRDEQESIYNGTTFEDFGQMVSSAGEGDLLDALSIIKDKVRELESKRDALVSGDEQ